MQRAKFGKGMFYRKTALGLAAALTAPALGASATWSGAGGDGAWSNPANWSGGSSPGSTSGTTNTDTATFASGGTGVLPVVVDAGRNLQSILFAGTDAYIIGTTGVCVRPLDDEDTEVDESAGICPDNPDDE